MRVVAVLSPILVVLTLALSATTAKTDCVEYFGLGPQPCSGAGGCESQWEEVSCLFGCTSGTCSRTNSTDCCGVIHYYAQIYGDGGDCS
jgi:hypothetical protein